MRRSRKPIVIASRRSPLARVQAEMVGRALGRLHPNVTVEYRWIVSEGDQVPADQAVAPAGGKGLFTRQLEQALLAGDAGLAVHSLKDLPARDTPGLAIAAVPARADVRDCLITRAGLRSLDELPEAAIVGTSSPRRAAQVLRRRPDLQIDLIRGNVDTRLAKVLDPAGPARYDATLLAAAGLERLGRLEPAHVRLDPSLMLPAAGQGALAIQCRADDHVTLTRCLPLNDPNTATAVHAEREVLAALGADCDAAVAVLSEPTEPAEKPRRSSDVHWYRLRVRVLSRDGAQCLEFDERTRTEDLRRLVKQAVKQLKAQGARELMAANRGLPNRPVVRRPGAVEAVSPPQ